MTEEIKTCDFYNEKICTLFSKYFGFNVECENVLLSTIDCDIERECPIKRLEQENKELLEARNHFMRVNLKYFNALEEVREKIKSLNKDICNNCGWYNTDDCQPNEYVCQDLTEIQDKINEVLK